MYHGLPRIIALYIPVLALAGIAAAAPVVVYDNTVTPTSGTYAPRGFWAFSEYAPNEPMGDQITLAGPPRAIRQFELVLSSSQPTALASLTLTLHDMAGAPAAELWSATVQNVQIDGVTTVAFDVPDVVVPDTFVWSASADSLTAGLATYDAPTVGSSGNWFWDRDSSDGQWYPLYFENSPVANFGARVTAVPEPASAAVLAFGWLLAAWRRRR